MKTEGVLLWDNIFDMYCWGSTIHGELGLGGVENEQVFMLQDKHILLISIFNKSVLSGSYTSTIGLEWSEFCYCCRLWIYSYITFNIIWTNLLLWK